MKITIKNIAPLLVQATASVVVVVASIRYMKAVSTAVKSDS